MSEYFGELGYELVKRGYPIKANWIYSVDMGMTYTEILLNAFATMSQLKSLENKVLSLMQSHETQEHMSVYHGMIPYTSSGKEPKVETRIVIRLKNLPR
jgi:hypothetical protein